MRLYHIGIGTLVKRFHFITALIVVAGFLAFYISPAFWYLTIIAFPVFMSCLLGIEFNGADVARWLHWKQHSKQPADYHRYVH
jgi:hypothetical protein